MVNDIAALLATPSGAADLKAFLVNSLAEGSAEDFFQHLTEQLRESGQEALLESWMQQIDGGDVSDLLPGGEWLPPPAISDPVDLAIGPDLIQPVPGSAIPAPSGVDPLATEDDAGVLLMRGSPNGVQNTLLASGLPADVPNADTADLVDQRINTAGLNLPPDSGAVNAALSPRPDGTLPMPAGIESRSPNPAVIHLPREFGQPQWTQEFSDRIVWMTGKSVDAARLQLNPPQLGPVEVRISVSQDQTQVAFSAHNPAVREAIEAAIPRLREMMGSQQLNLVNVDVSQQSFTQQHGRDTEYSPDQERSRYSESGDEALDQEQSGHGEPITTTSNGLLSYYV